MAQEASRAYDRVTFVGMDQRSGITGIPSMDTSVPNPLPKPAATKRAATKSPPVKSVSAKTVAAKKAVKTSAVEAVTVPKILAACPNLKAGQWQPLGDVAKVLHDKKLLAKSATSTKLFRKFPHHFELMPEGKPNQVRHILPPT